MQILGFIFILLGLNADEPLSTDSYRALATHEYLISQANYLGPEEKAMLWEINLVRTEPWTYASFVEAELAGIESDSIALSRIVSESIRTRVTTIDGEQHSQSDTICRNYFEDRVSATRELIGELKAMRPLPGLIPNESLYRAAVKHADSHTSHEPIIHQGSNGSWPTDRIREQAPELIAGNENLARGLGSPRDMVIQLLIDSGVDHRGHRKNILSSEWTYMACHQPKRHDEKKLRWWLQEFAY